MSKFNWQLSQVAKAEKLELEEDGESLSIVLLVTWSMHLLNLSLQQLWGRSQRKKSQAQSAGMF